MAKARAAAKTGGDKGLKTLEKIVSNNPLSINECNSEGESCISIAIKYQNYGIIDYLLSLDVLDINAGNNDITPIFVAINTRNEEIALKLLHHGANPNTIFPNDTTIIHYCIELNYTRIIHKLFENPLFDYKIITIDSNENIFHLIVDTENNNLLIEVVDLIKITEAKQDKNDDNDGDNDIISKMLNSLNNLNETALWKAVNTNQYKMALNILDPNIGNANIDCICSEYKQTIAHLIYKLYSINNEDENKWFELLNKYKANLSIIDLNGDTPIDIGKKIEIKEMEKQLRKELEEEQLLLQETMRMREKLQNSRISQFKKNKKNKKKHDTFLNIWLNSHELNTTSFSSALLERKINWNKFMTLSDDEIYEIIQNDCDDMNDDIIQYVLNQWNASKTEYEQNQKIKNEEKQWKKKKRKKDDYDDEKEEKKEENHKKHECNKYVKLFLSDYGLLELEFIFAKEKIDMTQLSEINNTWIEKYIVGNSNHVNNLKMRLKLAIKELRKEIVREMKLKIKKDYEEKYGDKLKQKMLNKSQRKKLRKRLNAIHPGLLKVEEILSDPLYLLLIGLILLIIFTFILFVIVGIDSNTE